MLLNFSKFAIVLSVLILGSTTTKAENSLRVQDNIYLSEGTEFNFKVFMNTKAKRYVKKNDKEWADFNKVVRLYNSSTGKFLSLSDQEKEDFYSAVASINSKLSRMRKEEAQLWLKKVDVTEKIFSFLWQERNIAEPVELFELPSVKVEPVMGR